jgi:hypothetical protein
MDSGLIGKIIMYVVAFNLALGGLGMALDSIKDKTATNVDNQVSSVLNKIVSALKMIIDFVQGNRKH